MSFLIILLASTGVATAIRRHDGARSWARYGMGAAFVVAGGSHLAQPSPFEQHLPGWVPGPTAIIVATGIVEIALGLAFIVRSRSRDVIGRVIAAYLVAVWPANIYVAVAEVDVDGVKGGVMAWIRIPLQLLFIAWALWSAAPVDVRPTEVTERPLVAVGR